MLTLIACVCVCWHGTCCVLQVDLHTACSRHVHCVGNSCASGECVLVTLDAGQQLGDMQVCWQLACVEGSELFLMNGGQP